MIRAKILRDREWPLGAGQLVVPALVLLLASAAPGRAGDDPTHPLEPPDVFSPRGTIQTVSHSIDEAWVRFSRNDASFREPYLRAIRCLDLSEFPPELALELGGERVLQLKEILDRIELPPSPEIPGDEEVRAQELRTWTIPHTELVMVRVEAGPHQGEFLFAPRTVDRIPEFFARVRRLPYQPGKPGGHYDEIRSGALSPTMGRLATHFPAWARREIGNQLLWQWAVVLGALLVATLLAALAFVLGQRLVAWEVRARGRHRLGFFLFPLALIALASVMEEVLRRFIRTAGAPYYGGKLVLTAISDLAIAWLIALFLTLAGEFVIRHSRAGERPLNAQLVRLSVRILTILVVAGFLFVAAESLGLPVPALVAGLGVGGLAVALATQGTLENLIGGLILYADQPVRVGEFFRFGDKLGSVEEIGLRSVRIRTLDRTVLAVPNAELIRMQLENFSRRDRTRLAATLRLRMETTPDQVRYLLVRLEQLLQQHPGLADDGLRVRFVGLGEYSLDVELVAMASTADWNKFLAVRQDVLLRAMTLVEEAGSRLAVPVQVELAGHDPAPDPERRRHAEEAARRLRDESK